MSILTRLKRLHLGLTAREGGPTLEVTTIFPCVNACAFCPQDKWRGVYRGKTRLTDEEFARLLERVPKAVRIDFSGFSEPFANRQAALMMRRAHRSGYRVGLFTTLVGLRPADVEIIRDVPFHPCNIHLPDDVNFRVPDEDRWLENFRLFARHVEYDNAVYHLGTPSPAIRQAVKRVKEFPSLTRSNNVNPEVTVALVRRTGEIGCTASLGRFNQNVVMPNGDVYLCCMDWSLRHRLGNLFEQDYSSLFDGEVMRDILRGRKDESVESICRYCEWSCKDAAH